VNLIDSKIINGNEYCGFECMNKGLNKMVTKHLIPVSSITEQTKGES